MATLYLDPSDYIQRNIDDVDSGTRQLGHVHLRVGDIPSAQKFYVEQLGFDPTADMGSALFVSVGGYHHHLAMNTWQSAGASKRDPSLGLGEVKFILPNDGSIDRLANRLRQQKVSFDEKYNSLLVDDPWKNRLHFTTN